MAAQQQTQTAGYSKDAGGQAVSLRTMRSDISAIGKGSTKPQPSVVKVPAAPTPTDKQTASGHNWLVITVITILFIGSALAFYRWVYPVLQQSFGVRVF